MHTISTAWMLPFVVRHLEILIFVFGFSHLYDNLTTSESEISILPQRKVGFYTVIINRASGHCRREAKREAGHRVYIVTVEQNKEQWRNRPLCMHIHTQRMQVYLS